MFEACFGECAYGYGERPVRTQKGYGTRSIRARMVQGKVDQRKLEAKLAQLKQIVKEVDTEVDSAEMETQVRQKKVQ
jgi:hypothetical protein